MGLLIVLTIYFLSFSFSSIRFFLGSLYFFNDHEYKQINYRKSTNISFRIIKSLKPDIYELYLNNETRDSLIKHSYASIPNIKTSQWLKELTDKKKEANEST